MAETVRQQLQDFQQHIPLIAALRNPGLRDRHWDKISAAVGVLVKADAGELIVALVDAKVYSQHLRLIGGSDLGSTQNSSGGFRM